MTKTFSAVQHVFSRIESRFPNTFNVPVAAAAEFIGVAYQTARNQILANRFPLSTFLQGGRRMVSSSELARYLIEKAGGDLAACPAQSNASAVKRGRGRPRKLPAAGCEK